MPVTYKCPSCGAAMEFDSTSQSLKCGGCGTTISVEEYERQYGEQYKNKEQHTDANMKVYHCQSCGAELVADEYTSATICSFCGNPSLVEDRLNGSFEPKSVIPFKIDREQAKQIYRGWVKKGPLTPKSLSTSSTIEKISGVYVPFWLYDFDARSQMEAKAEKVRTERHGDTEYIYTDHFHVYRDVAAQFEKIPADASEKMADDTMDKLEPFKYEELVPFSMPYLSGYLSERYNYTDEDMKSRVGKRVDKYITDITRGTINGYSSVSVMKNDISKNNKHNEYVLLPVWMLNYRYQGKDFQFVLNGQTGKIVADRPVSKGKAVAYAVLVFLIMMIITTLGGLFI
jgi:DNA-directed RNA polymerase subunit RPC12/RpoP